MPNVLKVHMPQLQRQYFCLSKLASAILFQDLAPVTSLTVAVLPKKGIQIHGQLRLDEALAGDTTQLKPYDNAVLDAIYTLYVNSCLVFTAEMAVRALYGDAHMDVTSAQRQAVVESIYKLTHIQLEFDATEEWRARKRELPVAENKRAVFAGKLLPLQEVTVRPGGRADCVTGFQLPEPPVLYRYAEALGQIASVPAELLQAGDLKNSMETMLLRRYLLRRIAVMHNTKNNQASHRIALEWYDRQAHRAKGLLSALGYRPEAYVNWLSKKSKIHKSACVILDGLRDAGYINGYTVIQRGTDKKPYDIRGYNIQLAAGRTGR